VAGSDAHWQKLADMGFMHRATPSTGNNCAIYALLMQLPGLPSESLDTHASEVRDQLIARRPDVRQSDMLHLDANETGVAKELLQILFERYKVNGMLTMFHLKSDGDIIPEEMSIATPHVELPTTPLRVIWEPMGGGHFSAL